MGGIQHSTTLERVNLYSYDDMAEQAYKAILGEKQAVRGGAKPNIHKKLTSLAKKFKITKKLLIDIVKSVHGDDVLKIGDGYDVVLTSEDYQRINYIKKRKRAIFMEKLNKSQDVRAIKNNEKTKKIKRLKSFLM